MAAKTAQIHVTQQIRPAHSATILLIRIIFINLLTTEIPPPSVFI